MPKGTIYDSPWSSNLSPGKMMINYGMEPRLRCFELGGSIDGFVTFHQSWLCAAFQQIDPLIIKAKHGKEKLHFRKSLQMEGISVTKSLRISLLLLICRFHRNQYFCLDSIHILADLPYKLQYFFTSHVLTLRWKRHDISTESPPTPCNRRWFCPRCLS